MMYAVGMQLPNGSQCASLRRWMMQHMSQRLSRGAARAARRQRAAYLMLQGHQTKYMASSPRQQ